MDKPFSKKAQEGEGLCNYCGKWKPTDLTPEQLEAIDWKCAECAAQRGQQPDEQRSIERGQKEISKYDPEYEFLVRLVKLLVKEGVSPEEIRDIANAYPFQTVDDVGDLTAKIWTLATEKYKIPREWLEKRLGKTASQKLSKPDSGYVDNGKGYTCGRCAYFNKEKETCALVEGTIKAQGCCNYWNDKYEAKEGTPRESKKEAVYIEYPNVDYRCDECGFFNAKERTCTKVVGDISPTASCNLWGPISKKKADLWPGQAASEDTLEHEHNSLSYNPNQEPDTTVSGPNPKEAGQLNLDDIVELINKGEPKVARIDMANHLLELTDGTKLTFDDAAKHVMEKQGLFSGTEFSRTNIGDNPTVTNDPFSSPEDHGAKPQKKPFPNTNWLPAEDEETDEQPWSNVASSQNKPFSKKAGPDTRYWLAPDGTAFPVQGAHSWWMLQNMDTLKKYGINVKSKEQLHEAYEQMLNDGWIRVSNEPYGRGFQIEIRNLNNIPSYVDDFIAQHYSRGETILVGDGKAAGIEVKNPFPTLQKAIRKRADLSGKTVNEILNKIHQGGGVTYNFGQGDLSGSNAFSVSIYPDRSQVIDGGVDFDMIENYLETNKDLLADGSNSFGAWSHEGKTYLDIVKTVENYDEAVDLGKQHNQIAIWDLRNNNEIPTGGTGEVAKQSAEQLLTQKQQNEIAAKASPAYVMAVNNYAEALQRGHSKDRSLEYAIQSVANIDKIDAKKLVEIINTYL